MVPQINFELGVLAKPNCFSVAQVLKGRAIVNIVSNDLIVLQHLATIVMSQQGLCH